MTGPVDGKRPEDLLWEVLGLHTYCDATLSYLIAGYLGRDEFSQRLVEAELVARKSADWKRTKLAEIIEREGFDVNPYAGLPGRLKDLTTFRDAVVHSQPDHASVLQRLRRVRGGNQPPWIITSDEIRQKWQLGIECQSQLLGLADALSRNLAAGSSRPDRQ